MKVWTPQGIQMGEPNGLAQKGEGLWDPSTNDVQYISKGKEGVDDQPVQVKDETFIPSNQLGFDKILEPHMKHISAIQDKQKKLEKNANMSSLSKQTAQIQQKEVDKYIDSTIRPVADAQAAIHGYNCGKDRRYAEGKMSAFSRMFPTIAGLTAGLGQLAHWGTNPIQYHSTYATNPYGTRALNELNQLRYNPYPDIQASQEAERRAAYANSQAGGMTGSQRYMGRIGLGIGAMRNAANVFSNAQQQNNNYRTQYANALLQEGNSIASRRQNANQHDWSDYVQAHGAKTRGIEQATANILGAINGGFQNEFKYRTWQDSLDIYRDKQKLDRDALNHQISESKINRMLNHPASEIMPYYYASMATGNPAWLLWGANRKGIK